MFLVIFVILDLYDILMKKSCKIFIVYTVIFVWIEFEFVVIEFVKWFIKMDEDQWMYNSIMSEEVEMNVENEEDGGVKVHCSDAFNTSEVFVQFVVVGTVIILHRCLLMTNLIWIVF